MFKADERTHWDFNTTYNISPNSTQRTNMEESWRERIIIPSWEWNKLITLPKSIHVGDVLNKHKYLRNGRVRRPGRCLNKPESYGSETNARKKRCCLEPAGTSQADCSVLFSDMLTS